VVVVVVGGPAAAGAEPIGNMGMEALIGDPGVGTTGVRYGWNGADPDANGNETFWTLERGTARSPSLHSMAGIEVERSDDEG